MKKDWLPIVVSGLLSGSICGLIATVLVTGRVEAEWITAVGAVFIGALTFLVLARQAAVIIEQAEISKRQLKLSEHQEDRFLLDRLQSDVVDARMISWRMASALDRISESGDVKVCRASLVTLRSLILNREFIWAGSELYQDLDHFIEGGIASADEDGGRWALFQADHQAQISKMRSRLVENGLLHLAAMEERTEGLVGVPIQREHRTNLEKHLSGKA